MILGQRLINLVLRPPMGWLLPYDVHGAHHLPRRGAVLVLMNHVNFIDVVIPGLFLPRDVVMLSKIENFRTPLLGFFVRAHGSLPVRRGEADLRAIRACVQALRQGKVLVIAPEGTRSGDGRLRPAHDGMALIASQVDVPVVPMVSYGHEHFRANLRRLRPTPLHVRIGPPFRFVRREVWRRSDLHAMAEAAMFRMAALLPPEYRGAYADESRAPAGYIVPCSSEDLV
ncbi:MAG: lysophospholipid acyltransferase family protein [Anaerolineae bacterium]